jgi:hypothetical protein
MGYYFGGLECIYVCRHHRNYIAKLDLIFPARSLFSCLSERNWAIQHSTQNPTCIHFAHLLSAGPPKVTALVLDAAR